jgi:hypothetical protein
MRIVPVISSITALIVKAKPLRRLPIRSQLFSPNP